MDVTLHFDTQAKAVWTADPRGKYDCGLGENF